MDEKQARFVKDMEDMIKYEGIGTIREEYQGRSDYCGPAVVVKPPERQLVKDYTEVPLKAEAVGKDLILYPV